MEMPCFLRRCSSKKQESKVFFFKRCYVLLVWVIFSFYFLLSVRGMTILLWNVLLIIVLGLKCWQSSVIVISAFKYNQILPKWVILSRTRISRIVFSSMNAYTLCVCHSSSNSCVHNFTSVMFSLCPSAKTFI